jgi:hypothetical protein
MAEAVAGFHFPDDTWARIVYDLVATARRADPPVDELVAALVPIYFGRVGSLVVDARHLTAEQAEERVERQAREFELLKPYLLERWAARSRPATADRAPHGGLMPPFALPPGSHPGHLPAAIRIGAAAGAPA